MNHIAQSIRTADQSPVVPTLSNMTKYNYAIVVGLVKDVPYQTNVQQLQQFESKNFRTRKALSEDDQSQTIASFMRDMVTGNISYVLEVVRKLSQHDNCDVEFEFGDRKPTKIMIRKAGSTRAVDSLVITFRTLMSDNSESTLCMISHDGKRNTLSCFESSFVIDCIITNLYLLIFDRHITIASCLLFFRIFVLCSIQRSFATILEQFPF